MAEHRPVWRGHLRLALVSCPVALYPAHNEHAALHFHFINPDTGNRVRMVTLDAETDQELSRRDLVRGYEFKKDTYVILTDEDFESAKIESSTVLNIEKFVPADEIDPLYYDATYYVAPDGDGALDVYAVLQAAIARGGRVALSRVVIARRERAIALTPMGRGLVAHTLHEASDVNDAQDLFADLPRGAPAADMVKLAAQLIDRQTGRFDPADMEDRYAARLREIIEAKLRGEGIEPEPEPEAESNVVDLMAALKRSLQAAGGGSASRRRAAPERAAPAATGAKGTRGRQPKPAPKAPARRRSR